MVNHFRDATKLVTFLDSGSGPFDVLSIPAVGLDQGGERVLLRLAYIVAMAIFDMPPNRVVAGNDGGNRPLVIGPQRVEGSPRNVVTWVDHACILDNSGDGSAGGLAVAVRSVDMSANLWWSAHALVRHFG